jgi:hypothetical protein
MDNLMRLDYFAMGFNLFFKGEDSFKTKFGGIFSLFSFILFILFCMFIGSEIFLKQSPIDTMTRIIDTTPPDIIFNVPIAFLVQDKMGTDVPDWIKFITIEAKYYETKNVLGDFSNENPPNPIKMRYCNQSDFSKEIYKQYLDMALDGGLCLDNQKIILGGDTAGEYFKYINITLLPCKNSSSNNYSCLPREDIEDILQNKDYMIALHHESLSYTSSNYENPVGRILIEDPYVFDMNICKIYKYHVQKFIIYSEQGFLFTSWDVREYYQFDYIATDFVMSRDYNDKCLMKFMFQSSIFTRTNKRTYLKISDVIAEVGGALNAYLIIFNILFKSFYIKKMNEKLLINLYKDVDDNLSNDGKKIVSLQTQYRVKKSTKEDGTVLGSENLPTDNNKISNFVKLTESSNNIKLKTNESSKGNLIILKSNNMLEQLNKSNLRRIENKDDQKSDIYNRVQKTEIKHSQHLKQNSKPFEIEDYELKKIEKMTFSPFHYFMLSLCKCCLDQKLVTRKYNFDELFRFSIQYIDIIEIVKKLHEFERMKYVLFSKEQIAIFNSISLPSNPFLNSKSLNFITEKFIYDNDKEAQKIYLERALYSKQGLLEDRINRRLLKLKLNSKVV